ncbi:hypothetical protein B7Y92_00440 [Candidatus Saccharibacteria bacterium 32-50-13]|nr:MAG: hypothetical protein B7Y92_00440 [Candidatus Saccharibacteria bacterium 32-50-13]
MSNKYKKTITVLQVVGGMNMGGVETFLMNVLRNINRTDYRFIFLCYIDGEYDYSTEISSLGATVVRIPDTRVGNPLLFIRNIKKVIEDESIDVVHSHVDFSSGYAMLAAKLAGIKLRIVHAHNTSSSVTFNLLRIVWLRILKLLMNRYANKLISCGVDAGLYMFGGSDFEVIRNGIDIKRFEYRVNRRAFMRRGLGIGLEDRVLLHVGRFEKQKNHGFLIDVFRKYLKNDPSSKLILIGDGRLRSGLVEKIKNHGIEDAVHMVGKVSNTEDYYSAADVFVMPSLYEGLPVSLVEAQANGLRCVVSDSIDATVNYGLIDYCSIDSHPEDWVNKIKSVDHRRNPVDIKLVKDYSIEEIVNRLEEIYAQ